MKIVLIGFATSFKSSVGKILAEKLNLEYFDSDSVIESELKNSVSKVFETFGEGYFREKENAVIGSLSQKDDCVIATGGGAPLCDSFVRLTSNAQVVHLTVNAQTVKLRLTTGRPLFDALTVEEIAELIEKRKVYYEKYANCTVSTDGKTSRQVADEVASLLKLN